MGRQQRVAVMLRLWWLWLPVGLVVAYVGVSDGGVLDPTNPFTIGLALLVWGIAGGCAVVQRRR
jgi:hypothetical protein